MGNPRILAVIVSFNGLASTLDLGRSLGSRVHHVLVVDNGSRPDSLRLLDELAQARDMSVVRLGENKGIGHALNLGIEKAKETGCDWLLTMDQDSVVDDQMIDAYRRAILRRPDVASFSPTFVTDGQSVQPWRENLQFAITSGNLVQVALFDEIGRYNEELFVDYVDVDFSLRVRRGGHRIVRVRDAILRHHSGDPVAASGWLSRFYLRHPPLRRYYMCRNHLWLMREYAMAFPFFVLKATVSQFLHFIMILVRDERPLRNVRFIARGIRDFAAGRMGMYQA